MLHNLHPEKLGPMGEAMAGAIQSCVHCGFCLPACPTYEELGQEVDSPRGRIVLMKEVLEEKLDLEEALPHIDQCLGCLACEPACPSGVAYRDLISPFRAFANEKRKLSNFQKLRRKLISETLPYPSRFRKAAKVARLTKFARRMMPGNTRPMFDLLPDRIPDPVSLAESYAAKGTKRGRVALHIGCAQQVLEPGINLATIALLTRHGVEVVIPKAQVCCGSLAWHIGDIRQARKFATINANIFPDDIDAVITNAAGCGSGIHEYGLMLKGTAMEKRADRFAKKTMDVCKFLHQLGFDAPEPTGKRIREPVTVAYHDACHLANAQGVRSEPRALLQAIPGVTLVEIRDPHLCCGSAGTYNIDQPEIAASLGEARARSIMESGASRIVTGNIGCLTQIRHHLDKLGADIPIQHTVEFLAEAYA